MRLTKNIGRLLKAILQYKFFKPTEVIEKEEKEKKNKHVKSSPFFSFCF